MGTKLELELRVAFVPAPPPKPDKGDDATGDGPRRGAPEPAGPPAPATSAADGGSRGRGELSRTTVSPRLLALLYSLCRWGG